jgi:hypothetical protein
MSTIRTLAEASFTWTVKILGISEMDSLTNSDKATLERHYRYLKEKKGTELIESIVRFLVLPSPDAVQVSLPKQGQWTPVAGAWEYSAKPGITVNAYLTEALKEATGVSFSLGSLQMWYVSDWDIHEACR